MCVVVVSILRDRPDGLLLPVFGVHLDTLTLNMKMPTTASRTSTGGPEWQHGPECPTYCVVGRQEGRG